MARTCKLEENFNSRHGKGRSCLCSAICARAVEYHSMDLRWSTFAKEFGRHSAKWASPYPLPNILSVCWLGFFVTKCLRKLFCFVAGVLLDWSQDMMLNDSLCDSFQKCMPFSVIGIINPLCAMMKWYFPLVLAVCYHNPCWIIPATGICPGSLKKQRNISLSKRELREGITVPACCLKSGSIV